MSADAARRDLILRIDALLPQTQCGKCDQPGCLPYAEAVAAGAPHHQCAPGGARTATALAQLLGRAVLPPLHGEPPTLVAYIREADCIGCAKCLAACPVDAIVGAAQLMHTVLADRCTGCDLCLPPCPVDCIELRPLPAPTDAERDARAATARRHHEARLARLARAAAPAAVPRLPTPTAAAAPAPADDARRKLQAAAASLRRQHREAEQALARMRRAGKGDLPAMQARVDALRQKADAAEQAAADAGSGNPNNSTRNTEP